MGYVHRLSGVLSMSLCAALGCGARTADTAPPSAEASSTEAARGTRAARLATILDELTHPPFGTGAALTVSIGSETETIVRGTLRRGGREVEDETPFNVASVSKLVTGAMVLSLVNEGRVDLDAPLSTYLPGVTLLPPDGDTPVEVTVRQLLAHRAGLPHHPPNFDPRDFGSEWTDPRLLSRMATAMSVRLVDEPGAYHYSNLGYALLAAILERVTEQSFQDVSREHLNRLGMRGATYWGPEVEERGAHGRVGEGESEQFNPPSWYGSRYALPFTGLWSSMPELHHFGRALVEAHHSPDATLHPMAGPIESDAEALGAVRRSRLGAPSIEHDGSGPGFLAWVIAIPERDVVLAVACNGGGESAAQGRRFFEITESLLDALR